MATFKKYDIGASESVVINVSSHIAATHLSKQIEKVVSTLDTKKIEVQYSSIGQNALHPKLMLSIIFYGYAIGIRSGRKLSKACEENLAFIYLSKGYYPKKSAINDFRKVNYKFFSNLFNQIVEKCLAEELSDPSVSIVDGSKIESNSAKRQTKTKEKFEKWRFHLLEDIASLEASNEVATEDEGSKKKLKSKKQLVKKLSDVIDQLDCNPDQELMNLTDPDAPLMKGKKGNFETNYNVQIGCGEDQVITYCDVVTQGNDKAQLIPALKGIRENTNRDIAIVLADADYGTYESLEYMATHQMIGYVPYRDMNAQFEGQPFHKNHFDYTKEGDFYTCPANQRLNYYRTRVDKKRKQHFKQYRPDDMQSCKSCSFKGKCVKKGSARRVIERETRQDLKDQMKLRLNSEQGQQMYRRRLHPVESFFGHIKYNLAYTRFLLRGLEKVKAEFILICMTYNLRKLITKLFYFLKNQLHFMQLKLTKNIYILLSPICQ